MDHIQEALETNLSVQAQTFARLKNKLHSAIAHALDVERNRGTIFWAGNGGSAADSQHMAAELVGRFKKERRAIKSIALTTNTSTLTAIANDYDYSQVFSRQLEALASKGDILFAISTSGNSKNIVDLCALAKTKGVFVVGLTGEGGGKLAPYCDILLDVSSKDTARIQECHLLMEHLICEGIEIGVAKDL